MLSFILALGNVCYHHENNDSVKNKENIFKCLKKLQLLFSLIRVKETSAVIQLTKLFPFQKKYPI